MLDSDRKLNQFYLKSLYIERLESSSSSSSSSSLLVTKI